MASAKTGHEMTRAEAMKDSAFRDAFVEARTLLRDSSVAFIMGSRESGQVIGDRFGKSGQRRLTVLLAPQREAEIDNPLELYVFEAYCAMELETGECNTFKTH